MVESYEDATEDLATEDDSNPGPEPEVDASVSTKTVEDIADSIEDTTISTPEILKPDSDGRTVRRPDAGGRRDEDITGIDAGNLEELNEAGLLQIVARASIAQLSAIFDIADAVEPTTNVTVSGNNFIDEADVPEPVVPESDNSNIPTKRLHIRASPDNNNPIYIGDDEVAPEQGFVLLPGENMTVETDLRGEELYMASGEGGEEVQLLGVI